MATTIISQPTTNKMMAAYRPISTRVQTDPTNALTKFKLEIIDVGGFIAELSPKPTTPLVAGSVLNINYGNFAGTYTLASVVDHTTFYEITGVQAFSTNPYIHENVTMSVNNVPQTSPNGPPPPIVFCDIYINSIFYKTLAKTQYLTTNPGISSVFEFDIQDATQEYLKKHIGPLGGYAIQDAGQMMVSVFCKFRTSTLDASGFLISSDLAPIQATGTTPAVAGNGLTGNTFFVVNATLQNTDNQTFQTHLSEYKKAGWNAAVFPMTHRPDGLTNNVNGSDYFPVMVTDVALLPSCLSLHYRLENSSVWSQADKCLDAASSGCVSPLMSAFTLPDAIVGSNYNNSFSIIGTAAFNLTAITSPSWMTVVINGSTVQFTGTPLPGDVITGAAVNFTVNNACGSSSQVKTINVVSMGSCVPVGVSSTPIIPDGETDVPYSYVFALTGTQPFTLSGITKPSWMLINVSGSQIVFSGTPNVTGTNIPVEFTINNCASSTYFVSQTIDVTAITQTNFRVTNETFGARVIESITPVFYIEVSGVMPLVAGDFYDGDQNGFSGSISVNIPGTDLEKNFLQLYKNGILYNQRAVDGDGGLYVLPTISFTSSDVIRIKLV